MEYTQAEIHQTVRMTEMEHLDIRTVTLGLSLRDCATDSIQGVSDRVREKIGRTAGRLVTTVDEIGQEIGIRVANKRISVTPVSILSEGAAGNPVDLGRAIDESAAAVGVDFIGGYSALVHKGFTRKESEFLDSIPETLSVTERLCSSLNVATTRAGINMDAVARVGRLIKEAAELTRERSGLACAKFVCFANAVEDNPFMAGAFHGIGEPEAVLNVGVSGPGVVNHALQQAPKDLPLHELAEIIKKLSFKLARAGELVLISDRHTRSALRNCETYKLSGPSASTGIACASPISCPRRRRCARHAAAVSSSSFRPATQMITGFCSVPCRAGCSAVASTSSPTGSARFSSIVLKPSVRILRPAGSSAPRSLSACARASAGIATSSKNATSECSFANSSACWLASSGSFASMRW